MEFVKFESELYGVRRKAIPKLKVNGYRHETYFGVHFYSRANIVYMFDSYDYTFYKYDRNNSMRLDVTFDDFRKFIDIEVVKESED